MEVHHTKGIANPQFKTSGLQIRWNRAGGFLGPIGLGISIAYFVVDLSTDGLNGWGKITY